MLVGGLMLNHNDVFLCIQYLVRVFWTLNGFEGSSIPYHLPYPPPIVSSRLAHRVSNGYTKRIAQLDNVAFHWPWQWQQSRTFTVASWETRMESVSGTLSAESGGRHGWQEGKERRWLRSRNAGTKVESSIRRRWEVEWRFRSEVSWQQSSCCRKRNSLPEWDKEDHSERESTSEGNVDYPRTTQMKVWHWKFEGRVASIRNKTLAQWCTWRKEGTS